MYLALHNGNPDPVLRGYRDNWLNSGFVAWWSFRLVGDEERINETDWLGVVAMINNFPGLAIEFNPDY